MYPDFRRDPEGENMRSPVVVSSDLEVRLNEPVTKLNPTQAFALAQKLIQTASFRIIDEAVDQRKRSAAR
jgi:hypothetical protein